MTDPLTDHSDPTISPTTHRLRQIRGSSPRGSSMCTKSTYTPSHRVLRSDRGDRARAGAVHPALNPLSTATTTVTTAAPICAAILYADDCQSSCGWSSSSNQGVRVASRAAGPPPPNSGRTVRHSRDSCTKLRVDHLRICRLSRRLPRQLWLEQVKGALCCGRVARRRPSSGQATVLD